MKWISPLVSPTATVAELSVVEPFVLMIKSGAEGTPFPMVVNRPEGLPSLKAVSEKSAAPPPDRYSTE